MRNFFIMVLASLLVILPRIVISQPNLEVTTSVISPQIRTFDQNAAYWRSLLNYRQTFGSFRLNTRLDYGSETSRYVNPLRVYEFNINWDQNPFSITIGRFNYWSSLSNVRVDGVKAGIATERFGKFELIGGFKSVMDFNDTTYALSDIFSDDLYKNKSLLRTSWSFRKKNQFINISYWGEGENDKIRPNLGITSNWRVKGLNIHETFVMDLEKSELNYTRFSITKNINNHRVYVGIHQLRMNGINPWPWVNKLEIPTTFNAGWAWRINPHMQWTHKVNVRKGSFSTIFYNSQFYYNRYYFSFIAGSRDNDKVFGGTIGMTQRAGKTMRFGSNVSLNMFDYNDIIEPINASSVYSWFDWNLKEKLSIKFFARYTVNTYYKKDGRAGVVVYVKI